jgi:transposase-like protein
MRRDAHRFDTKRHVGHADREDRKSRLHSRYEHTTLFDDDRVEELRFPRGVSGVITSIGNSTIADLNADWEY